MFASAGLVNRMNSALLTDEDYHPLQRAIKFAKSKLVLQRTVMARGLVEIAHDIGYDDFVAHLWPLIKGYLIVDPQPEVRSAVLSNFGFLSGFLIQGDTEKGYDLVLGELVPLLHQVLSADASLAVKNVACEALVVVAPHIRFADRREIILPAVLSLAHDPDNSSCRALSVSLLSGLSECLGSDLCTSFIVPQLCALSEDSSPDVRTATALSFVEVCNIVGPSVTCARLLPPFCRLATDSEWSIRKAFLESLLSVAQIIPPQRVTLELTPLLRELLNDSNRLVKLSAQRVLGPFIASLVYPELVPLDLVDEYLALASLNTEDATRLSFSDRGRPVIDLLAFHSAASLLSKSSEVCLFDDNFLGTSGYQQSSTTNHSSISDPPALCAYSFAAVLWTLCGWGEKLFELGKTVTDRTRPDKVVEGHGQGSDTSPIALRTSSPCIPFDVDLGGFESCASMGGHEYWWPVFRPALLTLLNSRGSSMETTILTQKAIASSLAMIASLILESIDDFLGDQHTNSSSLDSSVSLSSSSSNSRCNRRKKNDSEDLFGFIRLKNDPTEFHAPPDFRDLPIDNQVHEVQLTDFVRMEEKKLMSDPVVEPCTFSSRSDGPQAAEIDKGQSPIGNPDLLLIPSSSQCFKSKRIRGSRQRPENLLDVEGILDRLFLSEDSPPSVRTAMVAQLPEVLQSCPKSARKYYVEKLLETLQSREVSDSQEGKSSQEQPSTSQQDQQQQPSSLIAKLRLFSFGNSVPPPSPSQLVSANTPIDFHPRKLPDYWRLRHMCAITLPKYLDLFDEPRVLREFILPIFLRLSYDAAAVVRKAVCSAVALVLSKLCPILNLYFVHGGFVDFTFSSRRDLISIQKKATTVRIPLQTVRSLPTAVRREAESLFETSAPDINTESIAEQRTDAISRHRNNVSDFVLMKPPNFLKGEEVDVIKSILCSLALSSNYQHRITYIRIADAVLRGCVKSFFQLYFLRPLVRLSGDRVRNVRLVWASTMRNHVHKNGRLGDNALMVTAALSLLSSSGSASFQLSFQRGSSNRAKNLKRIPSASSIDLLLNQQGSLNMSRSISSNSKQEHHDGSSVTQLSAASTSSNDSDSPRAPPSFDSSFVGTDAEIRRHLGTISFASTESEDEGAASWNDGLDFEDFEPILNSDSNIGRFSLSEEDGERTSSPPCASITSKDSMSKSLSIIANTNVYDAILPRKEKSLSDVSPNGEAEQLNADDSAAPSYHHQSPRFHFLIAEPRPSTSWRNLPSLDVVGVPGMHVDELDGQYGSTDNK